MENVTPRQQELLERIARLEAKIRIEWDDERGVAASVRGILARRSNREAPARTVRSYLDVWGALYGPSDLARWLRPLRPPRRDDLGWTQVELQQFHSPRRGAALPGRLRGARVTGGRSGPAARALQ